MIRKSDEAFAGRDHEASERRSTTAPGVGSTSRLRELFDEQGQSAWLDNLTRSSLHAGTLARLVHDGVRGITANPTIIARAIESSDAYDEQFHGLVSEGWTVEKAYWQLVITDVIGALRLLRPTFDASNGADGFVSIEVSPECAHDTAATMAATRDLHDRIREPNLMVKIPATVEGVPAIQAMIGEGRNINVTLLFSLVRYAEILEAYLSGLEELARRGGDLSRVHSVASFFVSRVDTEVDRQLEHSESVLGPANLLSLRGRAGVAQAKLAYQLFLKVHAGERWDRLRHQGARVQRPLWASTSTKNPLYPDTLYVNNLIGPETVNTMSESTIAAFGDHGTLARTVDSDLADAEAILNALAAAAIGLDDIGETLEAEGIEAFRTSYADVLDMLRAKAMTYSGG